MLVAGGAALLVTGLIVADVLIVTDEEIIEDFADIVTDDVDREHIERALAFTDPQRQPILVEVRGQSIRYDREVTNFPDLARARLRPFEGTSQHPMRKVFEVRDNAATVQTETFSRRGRVAVDWELRKRGDQWLVSRVSVR